MKKVLTAALFMLSCLGCVAQNDNKMDATQNRITIGGGAAYSFNDIPDFQTIHDGSSSLELSVDYAHLWNISKQHAIGFEVNAYQSHLHANGCNIFYGGASIVYNFRTTSGWIFSASEGMGYAANDFDDRWDEGGIGAYCKVGAHYKLCKNLALGAELRMLSTFFGEKTAIGEHVVHTIGQYGLCAQLQWCF